MGAKIALFVVKANAAKHVVSRNRRGVACNPWNLQDFLITETSIDGINDGASVAREIALHCQRRK